MRYVSYREYLELPDYRAVCDEVRRRSGGICEVCKARAAIEAHHVAYCKWGEVDTPENLLDVCRQCHCDLHRCSRCEEVTLKAVEIKAGSKVCRACQGNHK